MSGRAEKVRAMARGRIQDAGIDLVKGVPWHNGIEALAQGLAVAVLSETLEAIALQMEEQREQADRIIKALEGKDG